MAVRTGSSSLPSGRAAHGAAGKLFQPVLDQVERSLDQPVPTARGVLQSLLRALSGWLTARSWKLRGPLSSGAGRHGDRGAVQRHRAIAGDEPSVDVAAASRQRSSRRRSRCRRTSSRSPGLLTSRVASTRCTPERRLRARSGCQSVMVSAPGDSNTRQRFGSPPASRVTVPVIVEVRRAVGSWAEWSARRARSAGNSVGARPSISATASSTSS